MASDHIPHPSPDNRNTEPTYVRFGVELRARVEAHRAELQASAATGVAVSYAAAIRNLVELGLSSAAAAKGRAA